MVTEHNNPSPKPEIATGQITYLVPDLTISAYDRGLFAHPPNRERVNTDVELHDIRYATGLLKGQEGLDAQGFTYLHHRSALSNSDQYFTGRSIEEVYLPEVADLICSVTGAKKAIVHNVAFRRKFGEHELGSTAMYMRDSDIDKMIQKAPRHIPFVAGRHIDASLEPARQAHVDYTIRGLRESARRDRHDIAAAAKKALEAEDSESGDVPRYAAYSIWRPLKTVKRDPLAVSDWRTLDHVNDLCKIEYRAPSENESSGDYVVETFLGQPPKQPNKQKWYWLPAQGPDDILVVKLADTESEANPAVAAGCLHASPKLPPGHDEEEPRSSIEVRVLAFW